MNNILARRVLRHAVDLIASVLKIPPFAVKMFRMADELSGLNGKTIPTELIPLNSIQLARGLLNYTALQSLPGWVFPYWAERQFDPSDAAFIPRSHLGLSINITRRNWAAVGSTECAVEPVVDPRGAVMPFRNRWSLDVWVRSAAGLFCPSRHPVVGQQLHEGLPIVETTFDCENLRITETVYVDGSTLVLDVVAENLSSVPQDFSLAFAIRPFNPEGVAPVHDITFDRESTSFVIDRSEWVNFLKPPTEVHCSDRTKGDSALVFGAGGGSDTHSGSISCVSNLANAYAAYAVSLRAGQRESFTACVPLAGVSIEGDKTTVGRRAKRTPVGKKPADQADVAARWRAILGEGAEIITPDERMNLLLRSSLCTLLLLTDEKDITPGPWTYHQFWFRDAAYMLRALDAFGFHRQAGRVLRSFPERQDRAGFFRSQQGEWDSNGQALWTIWQHAVLSGDVSVAAELLPAMRKGVHWIARKRLTGPGETGQPYAGLLPAGLSAEHLGLCDYYFWDNWWSAAGIQAFTRVAREFGREEEVAQAESLLGEYRDAIQKAVRQVRQQRELKEIPAGPLRGIDSGMIGSCAAWYPLQEISPEDEAMLQTMATIRDRFTWNGLFFQDFIHSGGNPYLSLQLAHAYLYAGHRSEFWQLLSQVADAATPVLNYPEAIHPRTGGGAMGDGHHGWAAAEIASALRGAIVEERWRPGDGRGPKSAEDNLPELVLLGGIPPEWVTPGKRVIANRLPVPGGVMSLELTSSESGTSVNIDVVEKGGEKARTWFVRLPGKKKCATVDGAPAKVAAGRDGETTVTVRAKAGRTTIEM